MRSISLALHRTLFDNPVGCAARSAGLSEDIFGQPFCFCVNTSSLGSKGRSWVPLRELQEDRLAKSSPERHISQVRGWQLGLEINLGILYG